MAGGPGAGGPGDGERTGVADLGAAGAAQAEPAPVARLGAASDPERGSRVADLAGASDLAGAADPAGVAATGTADLAGAADPAGDAAGIADLAGVGGRHGAHGARGDGASRGDRAAGAGERRRGGRARPRDGGRRAGPGPAPDGGSAGADPVLIVRPESARTGTPEASDDQQRPRPDGRRRGGPAQIDPDADPVAAAREICLRLLTDRSRPRQVVAAALRRRGVPDAAAEAVLERFDEVGLIDDAAFAGQWVRSRHRSRGLARRAIAMELRRKGVDEEVAADALAEVDGDAEESRARELVDRKLRTVPADTPEQRVVAARRLVGMLGRKGYPGGIAYRVVREALAAHGAADDEMGNDELSGEE